MKKSLIFTTIFLLSLSLVSGLQSPREGAEVIVDSVIDILEPIAGALFGGLGNENLFVSVLFFIVLLAFVYVILGRMDLFWNRKPIIWVVSVSVALLATRFTSDWVWVQFVLLPYHILGVTLLSVIPLIIYFTFLYTFDSGAIRKIGWALFICTYIGLWYSNFDQIGDIAYIYLFAGILGFIFLLGDKYVRGWIVRQAIEKGLTGDVVNEIINLKKQKRKKMEQLEENLSPSEARIINQDLDRISKTIRKLSRHPLG